MPHVRVEPQTPPSPKKAIPSGTKSVKETREEALNGIGQLGTFGLVMTGNLADAGAVGMHWPNIAREGAELAESNEYVAKAADFLGQVGPFAAILSAAMPLVLQILANHKVLPADKLGGAGVVKPEVLESQIKTEMAKQAIAALKAQQEAEEEFARMQAEYAEYANGESAKSA